ncbi:hypothetical protein FDG2_5168 [Candidatus Protofrankia californiensis]|uniref:DNA 3'-5' helicase n=1 Tax=Candidatus Protofrankia californiensis TaxID=1839754 RepID=A0A1C3PBB5_9ACTN|nr:hypothetical protein FDG2_5168 [Candidatus Protofrankia californiensis]
MLAASQADALQMLAAGYSVREARAELGIVGTARREAMSGVQALLASPSVFFPRGASELQEALNRPLDLWRIFLHPSQRRIAYRETYSGPVRVTGGAGTGKTVVAVHRAYYLAGRLPAGSTRPVLVTTFVRTLADNLRSSLGSLAGSHGYGNIEVTTVAIGVAARMKKSVLAAISTLRDAGLDACDLERKSRGGVEVGTMHRMKGLEYRAMAVIDVSAASVPLRWAVTPVDADPKAHEQDTLRERCLLYVACTRARELLTVSWSGHASPFLSPFLS